MLILALLVLLGLTGCNGGDDDSTTSATGTQTCTINGQPCSK